LLVGLHLGGARALLFQGTHFCLGIPNGLGRRRSRLRKCQGGCGIGRIVRVQAKAQTTLACSVTQIRGGSREDLLHSPPRECRATYLRIAHSIWISNHLAKTPYQTEAYPSVEKNTLSPLTLSVSLTSIWVPDNVTNPTILLKQPCFNPATRTR
jgi:hypothetical protein